MNNCGRLKMPTYIRFHCPACGVMILLDQELQHFTNGKEHERQCSCGAIQKLSVDGAFFAVKVPL